MMGFTSRHAEFRAGTGTIQLRPEDAARSATTSSATGPSRLDP